MDDHGLKHLHLPKSQPMASQQDYVCRACDKLKGHGRPLQTPQSLPVAKESPIAKAGGIAIEDLGMVDLPKSKSGELIHWEEPILQAWNISESAALATLDEFASVGKGLILAQEICRSASETEPSQEQSNYI